MNTKPHPLHRTSWSTRSWITRNATALSVACTLAACSGEYSNGDVFDEDSPEFARTEEYLSRRCAPEVDATIAVPEGNRLATTLDAIGSQVYICQASDTTYSWVLQAPDAILLNARGKKVGTHYAGPSWEYKDGSVVTGARLASVTPDPTSIPWLLIQATPQTKSGKFSNTTYIQRLDTVGGLAPDPTTCTSEHVGSLSPVEYTATYYFFEAGKAPCGCK
jgi:Protein of unknown function (DUF3455)